MISITLEFKYVVIRISHGASIIAKGSRICVLYILDDSIDIGHASKSSQDFHVKTLTFKVKVCKPKEFN